MLLPMGRPRSSHYRGRDDAGRMLTQTNNRASIPLSSPAAARQNPSHLINLITLTHARATRFPVYTARRADKTPVAAAKVEKARKSPRPVRPRRIPRDDTCAGVDPAMSPSCSPPGSTRESLLADTDVSRPSTRRSSAGRGR